MKYQKVQKQVDERDKLRKFRELDDAFALALRQLEDPDSDFDIPTGPPVRSLDEVEKEDAKANQKAHQQEQDIAFKQQFEALLSAYGLSDYELAELIETLLKHGIWQQDTVPTSNTVSNNTQS